MTSSLFAIRRPTLDRCRLFRSAIRARTYLYDDSTPRVLLRFPLCVIKIAKAAIAPVLLFIPECAGTRAPLAMEQKHRGDRTLRRS